MTVTETIREAVEREHTSLSAVPPLTERLQAVQAQSRAMKQAGGQAADKAFFDELSGHS
jgi:hypothetical protein